jgi:hypothetical protein
MNEKTTLNTPDHKPAVTPPQKKPIYKRWWAITLGVLVVLIVVPSLVGGGSGTQSTAPAGVSSASPSAAPSATADAAPEAAGDQDADATIGDRVRDGKFEFVVTKVQPTKSSIGSQYVNKKAQGKFVLVNITVTNIGDEPQSLFGDNQYLYQGDRKFSADTEAALYLDDSNTIYEEINPGNTVKGILVFDVPKNIKPERIELHDSMLSGGVTVTL